MNPLVTAQRNGHLMVEDQPAAMTSMRRHTCADCGRAVILRPSGSGYGSALEVQCDRVGVGRP